MKKRLFRERYDKKEEVIAEEPKKETKPRKTTKKGVKSEGSNNS